MDHNKSILINTYNQIQNRTALQNHYSTLMPIKRMNSIHFVVLSDHSNNNLWVNSKNNVLLEGTVNLSRYIKLIHVCFFLILYSKYTIFKAIPTSIRAIDKLCWMSFWWIAFSWWVFCQNTDISIDYLYTIFKRKNDPRFRQFETKHFFLIIWLSQHEIIIDLNGPSTYFFRMLNCK